ncbi:MAG: gamma-glutamyl-gamma-aminobutyrate hydrolase [Pseudonocardiales bacterium]|nr:MAG: gamma-glutamyl-gamma-aminobutyrate hydrolase [Pseudonocardiales bacterium]
MQVDVDDGTAADARAHVAVALGGVPALGDFLIDRLELLTHPVPPHPLACGSCRVDECPAQRLVPEQALELCDGLLLAGGADIDPSSYGVARHPQTDETFPERDIFEVAMVRGALERDLPLLGICRGMQLINVARGGTLRQHLPEEFGHHEHRRTPGTFDGADHDVRLAPDSLAARCAGETRHATKSHHHQGVGRLGDGLEISGWAELDDVPEAIEAPDRRFALGVQWHPEADESSHLIAALVHQAAAYRRERTGSLAS